MKGGKGVPATADGGEEERKPRVGLKNISRCPEAEKTRPRRQVAERFRTSAYKRLKVNVRGIRIKKKQKHIVNIERRGRRYKKSQFGR